MQRIKLVFKGAEYLCFIIYFTLSFEKIELHLGFNHMMEVYRKIKID